jgi:hypothetical protein
VSADSGYIEIPNWDKFQHYRNRRPAWIKCYVDLLARDEYLDLTFPQRGLLHGIWMEYARSPRNIPGDTLKLSRRLGGRVTKHSLNALVQAGFIEICASNVLEQSKRQSKSKKPPIVPLPKERPEVRVIYDHWRTALGKTDPRYDTLSGERRAKIIARLNDGYTPEQLCAVFDLASRDDWADRKRHCDIPLLLRSREKVDGWLDRSSANGNGHKPHACHCGQSFLRAERLAEHQSDVHGERTP